MKIRMMNPELLIPYPNNPRANEDAIESVAQSIKDFGFNQPIVADFRDSNTIVVGHTRREAAILLGLKKVPVIGCDHLTKKQIKAYRLADNRTNENSYWLENELAEELIGLSVKERKSTGFTEDEIGELVGIVAEAVPVVGRVEFSEELLESRNYIVLYFDNDVDWLSARTHFNLKSVYSKRCNGKPWSKGIGRVVDGAKYLRRITKDGNKKRG